jgi:hypothetical protein
MEGRTENVTTRGQSSLLETTSPLGSKFAPRGEVKNGHLLDKHVADGSLFLPQFANSIGPTQIQSVASLVVGKQGDRTSFVKLSPKVLPNSLCNCQNRFMTKIWTTSDSFKKLPQSRQSLQRRKFAQSGHPVGKQCPTVMANASRLASFVVVYLRRRSCFPVVHGIKNVDAFISPFQYSNNAY